VRGPRDVTGDEDVVGHDAAEAYDLLHDGNIRGRAVIIP
jgi:hypothetical protein